MNVYVNELLTHPIWTTCFLLFLWRIVISFRRIESRKEMVILITIFFVLMAASPVFIGVPFAAIQEKTIYGIMYLFVLPIMSVYCSYLMWTALRDARAPVSVAIVLCTIPGMVVAFIFVNALQKLFL